MEQHFLVVSVQIFHIICPTCVVSNKHYITCFESFFLNVLAPIFPPESFRVNGGHGGESLSSRDAETQPASRADQSRDGEDDGTTKLRQEHTAGAVWHRHHQQDQVSDSVQKVPRNLQDIIILSIGHGNQTKRWHAVVALNLFRTMFAGLSHSRSRRGGNAVWL